MLSTDQPLGDIIINLVIVTVVFYLGIGIVWFLLFIILKGILLAFRLLYEKIKGNNNDVVEWTYVAEDGLERIYSILNPFTFLKKFKKGLTAKGLLKYNLIVGCFWGVLAILAALFMVHSMTGNPYHEYLLITKGETAKGYITDAEEFVTDDDRGRAQFDYYYTYTFTASNGTKHISGGNSSGRLPDQLSDLSNPYPTEVAYLADNPEISRLKHSLSDSIWELLWRRIGFGGFFLIMFSSVGFMITKNAIKEYKVESKKMSSDTAIL